MIEQTKTARWRRFFWFALIALTIVRLGLFARTPYLYLTGSDYDDLNQLTMADNLLKTGWLGEYTHTTLIKGVSFPLFVALANRLYMPYGLALGLYYALSAGVFSLALYRMGARQWLAGAAFLWLIWSPISFGVISTRIYRNAILFPAVIHALGCLLMVYQNRGARALRQLPWLLWAGLSFAFFYYIREDSVWMLPLFAACMLLCAVWNLGFSGRKLPTAAGRALLYLIPVCVFLMTGLGYRAVNRAHYGVFTVNDRSSGAFAALTGNMIRVEDDAKTDPNIWISRAQMEKVIDACRSLSRNKPRIMKYYDYWGGGGDVRGDYAVWAFREALNHMGYYGNARRAEDFCAQVNEELMRAVKSGRLSFADGIYFTSQSRGFQASEVPGFLRDSLVSMFRMTAFIDGDYLLQATGEDDEEVLWMRALTGVQTIAKEGLGARVDGCLIMKDDALGDVFLRVTDGAGNVLCDQAALEPSRQARRRYPEYAHAANSAFTLWLDNAVDLDACALQVLDGEGAVLKTLPLNQDCDDADAVLNIESARHDVPYDANYGNALGYHGFVIALAGVLRWVSVALILATLLLAVWFWARFIRARHWETFEAAIILTGFLHSGYLLQFGITAYSGWLQGAWFYAAGVAAMGQASQMFAMGWAFNRNKENMENKGDGTNDIDALPE